MAVIQRIFARSTAQVAGGNGNGKVVGRFYTRPSNKRDDVLVIGVHTSAGDKRVALARVVGDDVQLRTLDGNPREASSNTETQTKVLVPVASLTDDN